MPASNSDSPTTTVPPQKAGAPPVARTLVIKGAALFSIWLLLSGKFTAFHVGVGLLSVVFLLWLHCRLEPLERSGKPTQIHPLRWVAYYFWLLWQMLLSAFYVARVIMAPRSHLSPMLVRFRCKQPNVVAAVTLANSITLTPGTLTVDLEDDSYLIHALTKHTARDALDGSMQARVARLFVDDEAPRVEELSVNERGVSRP